MNETKKSERKRKKTGWWMHREATGSSLWHRNLLQKIFILKEYHTGHTAVGAEPQTEKLLHWSGPVPRTINQLSGTDSQRPVRKTLLRPKPASDKSQALSGSDLTSLIARETPPTCMLNNNKPGVYYRVVTGLNHQISYLLLKMP